MASAEQTYLLTFGGGLDTSSDRVTLFQQPGSVKRLVNFEAGISGGYRRISGYQKYSQTSPDGVGTSQVVSAFPYMDGCVAVQGGNLYFTQDKTTWIQINKDTGGAFVDQTTLAGLPALTRNTNGKERYNFVEYHNGDITELLIVDTIGTNPLARFVLKDTGTGFEYKYEEAGETHWGEGQTRYPTIIEIHSERLVASGDPRYVNDVYYSNLFDPLDFINGGTITTSDTVTALKTFRENLVIFGRSSMKRVTALGDPANQTLLPISNSIGCIAGGSVQEAASMLLFLAPDGIRSLAATERFSDFELGSLTSKLHKEVLSIIKNPNAVDYVSCIVRGRNQYRLFVVDSTSSISGIAGVFRSDGSIEWNTFQGLTVHDVHAIPTTSTTDGDIILQTNGSAFVYEHDKGTTFDGQLIRAFLQTSELSLGDPNVRKTLHRVDTYLDLEGPVQYSFKILYDDELSEAMSPGTYLVDKTSGVATYDVSTYDDPNSVYDSGGARITSTCVEGSGKLITFLFESTVDTEPFTLQNLNIRYFVNGRH